MIDNLNFPCYYHPEASLEGKGGSAMYGVYITYREGVLTERVDTDARALRALGFSSVISVKTATYFELTCHPHTRKDRIAELSAQLLTQRGTQEGKIRWFRRDRIPREKSGGTEAIETSRAALHVTLKSGVHAPEAVEILRAAHMIGFGEVIHLSKGRFYQVACTGTLPLTSYHDMCRAYLANPVLEQWRILPE